MLTLYIKPTNYCSIDCDHCYLPVETRSDRTLMSKETLRNALLSSVKIAKYNNSKAIHIIWHGGEPMMAPLRWYEDTEVVVKDCLQSIEYSESIQTSLIPYTKKWNDIIHGRFQSFVGSSLDFSMRQKNGSSEEYINNWMNLVTEARNNKIAVIPGLVPSKHELGKGKDIISWLSKNSFDGLNIDRYSKYGNDDLSYWIDNKQHSDFLVELLDGLIKIMDEGYAPINVNIVNAAYSGLQYGLSGDRWGTDCQKSFIIVEPNGDLNTCPDRSMHEKPFSNINDGAENFLSSKDRRHWIRVSNITHKGSHCDICEYRDFCRSGCPITDNILENNNGECSGYKTFLKYFESLLKTEKGTQFEKWYFSEALK